MKQTRYLLAVLGCLLLASASAQIDLGLSLTGLLARNPQLSAEFGVTERIGVEVSAGAALGGAELTVTDNNGTSTIAEYKRRGYLATVQPKLYFNPSSGIDGLWLGLYARWRDITNSEPDAVFANDDLNEFNRKRLATGLNLGYKFVISDAFLIETHVGGGFAPYRKNDLLDELLEEGGLLGGLERVDLNFRLSVGYRIGG